MRLKDVFELVMLGAIWGSSFLYMRSATPEFGAFALVAVRTGIAALCLLPLLFLRKKVSVVRQYWRPILFVGLVNTAIPFVMFSYSTVLLGAGMASILNATAPMFGAIVAFLWLKERLTGLSVFGLFIGFSGVVVISLVRTGIDLHLSVLPILAALGSTFAYGIAACYTKKHLTGINTLAIATGSQVFATLALIPFAVMLWPQQMPSFDAWVQVIVLGVVCTGFAYILYFRLIANVGASKAITVAYLVPVFGVLWGVLFLQEMLTLGMLLGAGLILFGVSLTTGVIKFRLKLA
ncbi:MULTISPECIES: DMT family transporter [Alteromonadaceae]|uniref:DMT family transporter n=1 Tax=Alteromonadaceae TaxID=72275 RepID=UPI001C0880CB|nr:MULTISPECIES: DMT family transporter [Aliiglaciecola]MBU2878330.1 DMT family transporter [Aliiglaciecola lipolytica]MDO6711222.1 DMT family transporter [Aliiglaciecola sp. 2_MG-2023]MDO6752136.1 DMT family transporter [Aliiglaciecola sp. 1_MG-2023]